MENDNVKLKMEENNLKNSTMLPNVPKKSAWHPVIYGTLGFLLSFFLPMFITWMEIRAHSEIFKDLIPITYVSDLLGSIVLWTTGFLITMFIIFWKKNKSLIIGLSVGYVMTCVLYVMSAILSNNFPSEWQ